MPKPRPGCPQGPLRLLGPAFPWALPTPNPDSRAVPQGSVGSRVGTGQLGKSPSLLSPNPDGPDLFFCLSRAPGSQPVLSGSLSCRDILPTAHTHVLSVSALGLRAAFGLTPQSAPQGSRSVRSEAPARPRHPGAWPAPGLLSPEAPGPCPAHAGLAASLTSPRSLA